MNIDLQIEQLNLTGVNLTPRQRQELKAALEAELSRLLTSSDISRRQANIALPSIPIKVDAGGAKNPTQLGQQIAQSIYGGLNQ
jgi:hypothetical protein